MLHQTHILDILIIRVHLQNSQLCNITFSFRTRRALPNEMLVTTTEKGTSGQRDAGRREGRSQEGWDESQIRIRCFCQIQITDIENALVTSPASNKLNWQLAGPKFGCQKHLAIFEQHRFIESVGKREPEQPAVQGLFACYCYWLSTNKATTRNINDLKMEQSPCSQEATYYKSSSGKKVTLIF